MSAVVVKIIDICDECIDTQHLNGSTIAINTLTGDVECENCGTQSHLASWELLDVLVNLED